MKKFLFLILIVCSLGFTVPVADDLDYAMCDFVAAGRSKIQSQTGMYSEAVFWTAHEDSGPGTIRRYNEWLEANSTYVYYGLSETSEIQICVAPMKGKRIMKVKPWKCSTIGKKATLTFTTTGIEEYLFFIKTIRGEGIHISYLTILGENKY